MKTRTSHFTAILLVLLLIAPAFATAQSKAKKEKRTKKAKSETIQLFNGKDLNNWVFQLRDPAVDPATVFTVQNGVIHITGDPFGYMRTKEIYSDYKLHVEWRWPGEASNSGVFVHGQLPDKIWIPVIECQLQAGNAGDFVCMGGSSMAEVTNKQRPVAKKMAESSEKPVGEWNTMEIVCKANTIEVSVNGVLQNKGTELFASSGYICLQSEGKDIEFRNVYLNKLKN